MEKSVELKISGMSCVKCAAAIEKSLSSVAGVTNAQVDLGTEAAYVDYYSTMVTLGDLTESVKNAGFQVVHDSVSIKIGGMHCASCMKTVENALLQLKGIISVNVNLAQETAFITYNSQINSIPEIQNAIDDSGFKFLGRKNLIEHRDEWDIES